MLTSVALPPGAVTADALRGHVSFLASDALEGRDSPGKGLDVAAEYIASRFRAAGLKPMGDDGYFQTADWTRSQPNPEGFAMTLESGGQGYEVPYSQVTMDPLQPRSSIKWRWCASRWKMPPRRPMRRCGAKRC